MKKTTILSNLLSRMNRGDFGASAKSLRQPVPRSQVLDLVNKYQVSSAPTRVFDTMGLLNSQPVARTVLTTPPRPVAPPFPVAPPTPVEPLKVYADPPATTLLSPQVLDTVPPHPYSDLAPVALPQDPYANSSVSYNAGNGNWVPLPPHPYSDLAPVALPQDPYANSSVSYNAGNGNWVPLPPMAYPDMEPVALPQDPYANSSVSYNAGNGNWVPSSYLQSGPTAAQLAARDLELTKPGVSNAQWDPLSSSFMFDKAPTPTAQPTGPYYPDLAPVVRPPAMPPLPEPPMATPVSDPTGALNNPALRAMLQGRR